MEGFFVWPQTKPLYRKVQRLFAFRGPQMPDRMPLADALALIASESYRTEGLSAHCTLTLTDGRQIQASYTGPGQPHNAQFAGGLARIRAVRAIRGPHQLPQP